MARKSSVRYWESRGAYMCWHKGQQHVLASGPDDAPTGPTFLAAVKAHVKLTVGTVPGLTVRQLLEMYLSRLDPSLTPDTVQMIQVFARRVSAGLGDIQVMELKSQWVNEWISRQRKERGWGDATVREVLTRLRACIAWGIKEKEITTDPLGTLNIPDMPSRGVECVLDRGQELRIMQAAKGPLLDLMTVLSETGARPGELRIAEEKHFKRTLGAIVIPAATRTRGKTHKNGRHGRDRVIYLPPKSLAIVERLCQQYPTGPLFRSGRPLRKGKNKGKTAGWTAPSIVNAVIHLRSRANVPHFIAYSFRHTYAVRWLTADKPIAALAQVMGTSITMIQRHYGHLADQHDYLRELAGGSPPPSPQG